LLERGAIKRSALALKVRRVRTELWSFVEANSQPAKILEHRLDHPCFGSSRVQVLDAKNQASVTRRARGKLCGERGSCAPKVQAPRRAWRKSSSLDHRVARWVAYTRRCRRRKPMTNGDDPTALARLICEAFAEELSLSPERARLAEKRISTMLALFVPAVAAGRAAGAAAHELRNPLAVIATSVALLRERVTADERAMRHVERIERQASLAARIAGDFVEAGSARPPSFERLALRTIVERALEDAALPEEFSVVLGEGLALKARIDERRTRQVLSNLLRNAVEACGKRGVLSLSARRSEEHIVLTIRDDGPGVPQTLRSRLFSLGATYSSSGYGFGLALARSFARAQGGDLRYIEGDRGACFELWLVNGEDA
jgi:signal transduction histidine kinase